MITIKDTTNYTMNLYLWGQRAFEFNGDETLAKGQSERVLILFVATIVKPFRGGTLSGNSACRWYINPDIPEAHARAARSF
ncbi:hypothetical protein ACP4OV_022198 [Aristida adscensionis]